jgi:hypothetical protein
MAVGHIYGFFKAEMILMKYCPKNKPDGKCFQVPKSRRLKFMNELIAAGKNPVRSWKKKDEK